MKVKEKTYKQYICGNCNSSYGDKSKAEKCCIENICRKCKKHHETEKMANMCCKKCKHPKQSLEHEFAWDRLEIWCDDCETLVLDCKFSTEKFVEYCIKNYKELKFLTNNKVKK